MIGAIIGVSGAYLVGSISSAIVVCRVMGLPDPRTQGSHNPGATNVWRIGGKWPAILTLGGDLFKGLLPVLVARGLTQDYRVIGAVMIAAVVGHVYPVFFKFRGGKGVATMIGGLLALSPLLCSIFLTTWGIIFAITRVSSLSALLATVTLPMWAWFLADRVVFLTVVGLAILVIWRHQSNIRALWLGREKKL